MPLNLTANDSQSLIHTEAAEPNRPEVSIRLHCARGDRGAISTYLPPELSHVIFLTMKAYQITLALDGRFDVLEVVSGEVCKVVSRHPTKDAAREWLAFHLKLTRLDDLSEWLQGKTR